MTSDKHETKQPSPAGYCLTIRIPGQPVRQALLDKPALHIGRGQENDIALPLEYVSRKHGLLEQRGDLWIYTDLESSNGTFVNGRQAKQVTLNDGDVIRIGDEMGNELCAQCMPLGRAYFWLVAGLVLLIGSSRLLVWGAVEIAHALGVSDLIIGLTVVALGTSLPELASSIIASRKGEHDIALGNVLGSNLFNTLAVVGIAGTIHPMDVEPEVISRDIPVMTALTLSLFLIGFRFKRPGRINRYAGAALLTCYIGYTAFLARTTLFP